MTYTCILGAHYVFDTTFSRELSLIESCNEFVRRYQRKDADKEALPMLASACPGMCMFIVLTAEYIKPIFCKNL